MKQYTRRIGYYPPWTAGEMLVLRKCINRYSYSELAELLPGRTVDAIKTRATMAGIPRCGRIGPVARRTLDERFFARKTLLSAYWAGFLAADGCIITSPRREVKFGLHQKDADALRRFAADTQFNGKLAFRKQMALLTICAADQWIADLQRIYEIGPRKTYTLEPPKVSGELALAYSIGFIDGDGCWATHQGKRGRRRKCLIVVGRKRVLEWLRQTWESAGANTGKSRLRFSRNIWRLSIGGSFAESVANLLLPINVPKLERKWRIARGEATHQERRHKCELRSA